MNGAAPAEPAVTTTLATETEESHGENHENGHSPSSGAGEKTDKPFTFRNKPRARPTLVCKECRRMKLKCDRQHPCSMCVKRSTQHLCEYETPATTTTRKKSRAKGAENGASHAGPSSPSNSHDDSASSAQHSQSPEAASFIALFHSNLRLTTSVSELHGVCFDYLQRLPPPKVTNFLLNEWYTHADMLTAVIHWPTFLPEARRILDMRTTGIPNTESTALLWFISLLMAGFAVTLLNIEGHEVAKEHELSLPDAELMLGMSKAAWHAAETLNAQHTLVTLQALQYHGAYLQFCGDRSRPVSQGWALIGLTLAIAEELQLHKDPGDNPTLSTVDREIRRRLWWSIYMSERIQGLNVNKPPLIRDSDITTRLPLNLTDEELMDKEVVCKASSNAFPTFIVQDGPLSTFIYKCGSVQLRGRVRDHLQSRDAFRPTAVMELHSAIQGLMLMIPGELTVPDHLRGEERAKAEKAMNKRARERCLGVMSLHELLLQIHSRVLQPLSRTEGTVNASKAALDHVMNQDGHIAQPGTVDPLAFSFHTCITSAHAIITACATIAGYAPETSTAPTRTALAAFTITSTNPIIWNYPGPARPGTNTHISFGHKCFQGAIIAGRCILHHPTGVFVKVAQADLELAADLIDRTGYDKSGKMKMILDVLKDRIRVAIEKGEVENRNTPSRSALVEAELRAHMQSQMGGALAPRMISMGQPQLQTPSTMSPSPSISTNGSSPVLPAVSNMAFVNGNGNRSPASTIDPSGRRVPIQPSSGMCSSIPASLYGEGTDFFSSAIGVGSEFFANHPALSSPQPAQSASVMTVDSPATQSDSSESTPTAMAGQPAASFSMWPQGSTTDQFAEINQMLQAAGLPTESAVVGLNLNLFDPPFSDSLQPMLFDTADQLMDWYSA